MITGGKDAIIRVYDTETNQVHLFQSNNKELKLANSCHGLSLPLYKNLPQISIPIKLKHFADGIRIQKTSLVNNQ